MRPETTLTFSGKDNSALLQKILKVLEQNQKLNYMFFDNLIEVMEPLSHIKLYEDEESSISCCLAELVSDNQTDRALKFLQHITFENCDNASSYNIFTGVLGSRSDQSIYGVINIISTLLEKGLKVESSSEDNKSVLEYAAEQFLHSISESSNKSKKVIEGDREILLMVVKQHSLLTDIQKENFIETLKNIGPNRINSGKREDLLKQFKLDFTPKPILHTSSQETIEEEALLDEKNSTHSVATTNLNNALKEKPKPTIAHNIFSYLFGIESSRVLPCNDTFNVEGSTTSNNSPNNTNSTTPITSPNKPVGKSIRKYFQFYKN